MLIFILAGLSGLGLVKLFFGSKGLDYFKIFIFPSLGLIVFSQLTLLFSFIFGLKTVSIILALAVTLAGGTFLFFKNRESLFLKKMPVFFLFLLLPFTFFVSYIWITQTLFPSDLGFTAGGSGMFGDTALHAAYASRLETGEFPPQNPLFAGKILIYPYANDLLSAVLVISGMKINLAFVLPQIVFFAGVISVFYLSVKKFTNNLGVLLAGLILFLGWGTGFLFLFREWSVSSSLFELTKDYTNYPAYNLHFHNILTGLILPERSFLPGLFLGLLMFLNFLKYFSSKKRFYLLTNGMILGILPFWHTHTFIFFSIFFAVFGAYDLIFNRSKRIVYDYLLAFGIFLLLAAPFVILFLLNHSTESFLSVSRGWYETENPIIFWFKNSFLVIPMALAGIFLIPKEKRLFFVPAFVVFIIANVIIFQPWNWDNIKLLSWSFLFFAVLGGVFLSNLSSRSIFGNALIILAISLSTLSGIFSLGLQMKNKFIIYDNLDIDLANWAKTQTAASDIFMIDPIPNHPITGLAGRLVFLGYPGHLWVHGINYSEREEKLRQVFGGDTNSLNSLEVPVNYLIVDKKSGVPPTFFSLNKVFENQKYIVFKI